MLLFTRFEELSLFCANAVEEGDMENSARMQRMITTMEEPKSRYLLKFELGVVTIVCDKLIKATYNLEGDSCCSLVTYDMIVHFQDWLNTHIDHLTFPGVMDVVEDFVTNIMGGEELYEGKDMDTMTAEACESARSILIGGVNYFNSTIMEKLSADLEIFMMCRFANPLAMRHKVALPGCILEFKAVLQKLKRFPAVVINRMVGEWNIYKRLVRDFPPTQSEGVFKFQIWSSGPHTILLYQNCHDSLGSACH